MKNSRTKLVVKRETVRELNARELGRAAGAAENTERGCVEPLAANVKPPTQ